MIPSSAGPPVARGPAGGSGPGRAPRANDAPSADSERLNDIAQKLRCWGYLSHFPDAEQDVAWLVEKLVERDERIAELKARLKYAEWTSSLP